MSHTPEYCVVVFYILCVIAVNIMVNLLHARKRDIAKSSGREYLCQQFLDRDD